MQTAAAQGEPAVRVSTAAPPVAWDGGPDGLVRGPWNRLALEAARRFVETRGAWARVLLVTGGEGTGKTSLLGAIENGLRDSGARRPATMRIGSEDFLRQFTYAVTHNRMGAFRQKFRSAEILLFDDVDRLAHRPATQAEFLHMFDHLDAAGRGIVLTCRIRPREIQGLTRTLQSRLASAMQVRLEPPDEAGRRSLVQAAALRERRTLPPEVLGALAAAPGSARAVLERWVMVRESPTISVASASAAGRACRPGPSLAGIAAAVARLHGLETRDLAGEGRSRRVTIPRHICFHLAKKLTGHSLQEIAAHFGNRNHATVLYACRKIAAEMEADPGMKLAVEQAERAVAVRES